MLEPLVVLIYSHKRGYQTHLEQQLDEQGIERVDWPLDAFSWRSQLLATRDAGKQFSKRFLLVIDAWDQVLMGTKRELSDHIKKALLGHVTLAGAKSCWPDDKRAEYALRDGPKTSPWFYINNSPLAGFGDSIARAIDWGLERFPLVGDAAGFDPTGEIPERFWTRLYLEGPRDFNLRIDRKCELNQTHVGLVTGDLRIVKHRIYNTVTDTWPIFLHLNGGATLPYGLA